MGGADSRGLKNPCIRRGTFGILYLMALVFLNAEDLTQYRLYHEKTLSENMAIHATKILTFKPMKISNLLHFNSVSQVQDASA